MSLAKLFSRIIWHNNTTPAINEDNLNAMSKGLDDLDNRVIGLAGTILEDVPLIQQYLSQADELVDQMENLSRNPPYIGENGNWYVWNTSTNQYEDSNIDASITLTIADITMLSPGATPYVSNTGTNTDPIFHLFVPRGTGISGITKTATSGLVDTYTITFSDGYTSTFTVTNGKTAYQYAQDGGYQGTEAQFETDLGNFQTYASNAQQGASDAEAYAKGTRNGSPVASDDPAYHNSSKYYSEQAASSAQAASGSATSAANEASDAEAYGAGTRNGVPVGSSDPAYHNNAPYYAQQAAGQTFAGLSDVDIDASTLANGQVPVYNSQTQQWENGVVDVAGKMNKNGNNAESIVQFPETLLRIGDLADVVDGYESSYISRTVVFTKSSGANQTIYVTGSTRYQIFGRLLARKDRAGLAYVVINDIKHFLTPTQVQWNGTDFEAQALFDEGSDIEDAISAVYEIYFIPTNETADNAVAVGNMCSAIGAKSVATYMGESTGVGSAAFNGSIATKKNSFATNQGLALGINSHAEGGSVAYSSQCHAEGQGTVSYGTNSHSEGQVTLSYGIVSHAEGYRTKSYGAYSHSAGSDTTADHDNSTVMGTQIKSKSKYSLALGGAEVTNNTSAVKPEFGISCEGQLIGGSNGSKTIDGRLGACVVISGTSNNATVFLEKMGACYLLVGRCFDSNGNVTKSGMSLLTCPRRLQSSPSEQVACGSVPSHSLSYGQYDDGYYPKVTLNGESSETYYQLIRLS